MWDSEVKRYPPVYLGEEWREVGKGMVWELVSLSERSERRLANSTLKTDGHIPHILVDCILEKDIHQGWRYVPDWILHNYATK